jgi:hypothetical protein
LRTDVWPALAIPFEFLLFTRAPRGVVR